MHDYAGVKDHPDYADHHQYSAYEAENILVAMGYPQDRIQAVKQWILSHRASAPEERKTPKAECLANADAAAHILQVPLLLKLAYTQYSMGVDEGASWVKAKISRSWAKLHPVVQRCLKPYYEAALLTLNTNSPAEKICSFRIAHL